MGQLLACNISPRTAEAKVQSKTCSCGMASRIELARVFLYEPPAPNLMAGSVISFPWM
jgi:hypothetical protein